MLTENAKIKSTHLGYEHGFFTFIINLEGPAWGQSFGGMTLIGADGPWGAGLTLMSEILNVVGCDFWEDLPGRYCRIRADIGKIESIGHIIEDRWVTLSDYLSDEIVSCGS